MDVAAQFQGYAFTDRGTYLVHAKRIRLADPRRRRSFLLNIYSRLMPVNQVKFPKANTIDGSGLSPIGWYSTEGQDDNRGIRQGAVRAITIRVRSGEA